MTDQTWDELIHELPIILAGPLLRHATSTSVTVWVALKQPSLVELTVYETTNAGEEIGNCLLAGRGSTVALGKSFHVIAVTAQSTSGNYLTGDRLYAYDLQFSITDRASSQQTLQQALSSSRFPTVSISYFTHQKPTFVLPPHRLEDLRIVQGSCRKPHGGGFDALPILDCLIEEKANLAQHRPHQLFLTGDQIYGDDVAEPFLWLASALGDALLGWEEKLPVGRREPDEIEYLTPKNLPFGSRAEIATNQAGFTAGLRNKRAKVNSHLLSLGEYYACYLLFWSPACWLPLPQGRQISRDRQIRRHWDRQARVLRQFTSTLWKVRRALANIPTYTIFDDHDVSDDWNLNRAWCLRVLGRPLGRRAVQNALLAYAVFQAWGNTPGQFAAGRSGAKLLAAADAWSTSGGTDAVAYDEIARYVGMPVSDPQTGLPTFVRDDSVLILQRHPEAIAWHYTVRSHCHETFVLDTRTWRGYPSEEKPSAPPMLLCPTAFEQQLSVPLRQSAQLDSQPLATFVIAPTNVFHLKAIDWIHHWQLRNNKVFAADVGDAWNINLTALAQLLTTLFEQRQQVAILSGDIHYSSMVRLTWEQATSTQTRAVIAQLTCSALKNEETLTRIVHTRLKDLLLPERTRRWIGWSHPPDMVELSPQQSRRDRRLSPPPDWLCALEWLPRQNARTPSFGNDTSWLISPRMRAKNNWHRWLQPLLFWKSRCVQEGREAIGKNNLALVQFESAGTSRPSKVIQDLYWFSSWHPTQIVYSRFESNLTPPRHSA